MCPHSQDVGKMTKFGDKLKADNARWSFEGNVCDTFDDHASKSIPFYEDGHNLIARVSDFSLNKGSTCSDLGCSHS